MPLYDGPLRPGVFRAMFTTLAEAVETATAAAVAEGAQHIRDDARNSFVGQHPLHEPSPARRGGPPSRISRTLDESLTWTTPLRQAEGWVSHIGAEPGRYPYYNRRIDSATYGYYLEMGLAGKRHLSYPFLRPALERFTESKVLDLFKAHPFI